MSNLSWSAEAEKSFITNLGTYSEIGKAMGREALLKLYLKALKKRSTDSGIDVDKAIAMVKKALAKECLEPSPLEPQPSQEALA